MNKNAIVMAAVVLTVAAGTYYGLEMIAGKPKPEVPPLAATETPDAAEVVVEDTDFPFPESASETGDAEVAPDTGPTPEMPEAPDMTAEIPAAETSMESEPAAGGAPLETPAAPPPEVVAEPMEEAPPPEPESATDSTETELAPMDSDAGMESEMADTASPDAAMTPEAAAEDPAAIAAQAAEQAARVAAEQAAREAARQAVEEALRQNP